MSMNLIAGIIGTPTNACAALCAPDRVLGVCEQERVTRVRSAGVNASGLPDEALDELLKRSHASRRDVSSYVFADPRTTPHVEPFASLDHHFAHACSTYFASPFEAATVLICDHELPYVSVWEGRGQEIVRIDWPWYGAGFANLYSKCAAALGFTAAGGEQRMEALGRLKPDQRDPRCEGLFTFREDRIDLTPAWLARVECWAAGEETPRNAALASALQTSLADALVELIAALWRRSNGPNLCLGGSLFYNSYFNSRVKACGVFEELFVPVNPGNAGLAVGAALHGLNGPRLPVTAFLGPAYTDEEIKATLDNCKLTYQWVSESDTIAMAVDAIRKGSLVAWFDGPMEWGPRALGNRSIIANPFSRYVLDNLNRFLKQREAWRGYGLSGLEPTVHEHFEGPRAAPYMECDYMPRDANQFQHILPERTAAVRVQTVPATTAGRFGRLLDALQTYGVSMVVNTSFNGFREPIVCNPRDALRVFYGTGLDLLIIGSFVISK